MWGIQNNEQLDELARKETSSTPELISQNLFVEREKEVWKVSRAENIFFNPDRACLTI